MILNLGCENDMRGDVRVDKVSFPAVTHIVDLEEGLPFLDDTFNSVYAYSILEHIYSFVLLMNEIFRCSREDASLDIIVPYWSWEGSIADPSHVRQFSENTWMHFSDPRLRKRLGVKHGFFKAYDIQFTLLDNHTLDEKNLYLNVVHEMQVFAVIGKV